MKKNKKTRRKPYLRPRVEPVVLMPEEMVLGACKSPGGGGCPPPGQPGGRNPGS